LDKDPETEQEKKQTASDLESVEEEMGGGMRPMLHELTNKAFPKWTKKITDFYYRNLTLSYDVIHPYPLMNKHKSKDPVGKTLLILDSSVCLTWRTLRTAFQSRISSGLTNGNTKIINPVQSTYKGPCRTGPYGNS